MGLGTRMGRLQSGNSPAIIVIFILVSVLVSIFNYYFFTSAVSEHRANELAALFQTPDVSFEENAKNILNSRSDVLYVRLIDQEGILQHSYGNGEDENVEPFPITTEENNTILLGLTGQDYSSLIMPAVLWSALIGLGVSIISLLIFSFAASDRTQALEDLISAMKQLSRGDKTAQLELSSSVDDITMLRVMETFNQMTENLDITKTSQEEEPSFQPTIIGHDQEEEEDYAPQERTITVFVAKIADFQELSTNMNPEEFTGILEQFRNEASDIVANYGGRIEALLKDEVIAVFNSPQELNKPELRSVCAAVEVLQVLAGITRERKLDGKTAISGKIGIGLKPIAVYEETGMPHGVRDVTDIARTISQVAPLWRVIVSTEVYNSVSEFVDAREMTMGNDSYYSIVGVEEGIV